MYTEMLYNYTIINCNVVIISNGTHSVLALGGVSFLMNPKRKVKGITPVDGGRTSNQRSRHALGYHLNCYNYWVVVGASAHSGSTVTSLIAEYMAGKCQQKKKTP